MGERATFAEFQKAWNYPTRSRDQVERQELWAHDLAQRVRGVERRKTVRFLLEQLEQRGSSGAAELFGAMGVSEAVPALERALEDHRCRFYAAEALLRLRRRHPAARTALLEELVDGDSARAAGALCAFRDPAVVEALRASLRRDRLPESFGALLVVRRLRRDRWSTRFFWLGCWVCSPLTCIHREGMRRLGRLLACQSRGDSLARFENPLRFGQFRSARWTSWLAELHDEDHDAAALCRALSDLDRREQKQAEYLLIERLGMTYRSEAFDPRLPAALLQLSSRWGMAALRERLESAGDELRGRDEFRTAAERAIHAAGA